MAAAAFGSGIEMGVAWDAKMVRDASFVKTGGR